MSLIKSNEEGCSCSNSFVGGGAELDCLGFMQIQSLDLPPELQSPLWYFYTLKHKAKL